MKTLDAEVFAVGRWNGKEFRVGDLMEIVRSFNALRDNLKVPLKFGHNDEQPMTDGHPALGWVDELWVDGQKLMAKFVDLPDVVYNAIKKKLYRKVSIELDLDVDHKGRNYPFVLTGVALLGADIPAVSTLADLTAYMGRGADFRVGRRAAFSAVAGTFTSDKETKMDLKELTDKVTELSATVGELGVQNANLATENATLKAKVEAFTAQQVTAAAEAKKAKIAATRAEATRLLEEAVKANAITPAQRTSFTALLALDNDDAVYALDLERVKALAGTKPTQFTRGAAQGSGTGAGTEGAGEDTRRADVIIAERVREVLAKSEAKDHFVAQQLVLSRDPALARRYLTNNDEEK